MEHLEDILIIRLNKEILYSIFENEMTQLEIEYATVDIDVDDKDNNGDH